MARRTRPQARVILDTPAKVQAFNMLHNRGPDAKLGDTVPPTSRYANIQRCTHADGTKLDSKRELRRYEDLLLLERAGRIRELEVHPRIPICIEGVQILMRSPGYPNGRKLTYVADFRYVDIDHKHGTTLEILEDVKMQSGHRTEVYKIKRALVEAMGLTITEY